MADRLGWGILGTGRIATALAKAINASDTAELVAVGSRNRDTADAFADQWGIPHRHDSYEGVLGDGDVDVVYISLPNHLHAPWTIKCAEAGKHILCEKPLAMNLAEAQTMIDAARQHDVFFMEAFMYRCHPLIAKLAELVREDAIGAVRLIQSTFSFRMDPEKTKLGGDVRLFNRMGGGGILDVGCYTMSLTRLIVGALHGKEFADPLEVNGAASFFAPPGDQRFVDIEATAAVRFAGPNGRPDIVASLACGMGALTDWPLNIYGEEGHIKIANPWFAHKCNAVEIKRAGDDKPQVIKTDDGGKDLYHLEVDTVAAHIDNRQVTPPGATWADSLSNIRALDMWRDSVGLKWETQ